MTDTALLRDKIERSGYKLCFVAKELGITYHGLLNKLHNRSEFRASEIKKLQVLLKLTNSERDKIFFKSQVGKTATTESKKDG